MKKSLIASVVALASAVMLFVGCASSGAKASDAPVSVHPREYTLGLSDSKTGPVIPVVFNEYGPNYQSNPAMDYTKNIRKDKPKAGDTIHVNYKFTTDLDISALRISLIDPTVNYWLELAPDGAIILYDIKAGETVEGSEDIVLTADVKGEFKVYLAYDNEDLIKAGAAVVGAPSTFTFEDVAGVESTDVALELPASEVPTGPKTIEVNINKIAAFCEVVTGHPWIDGKQIMSEIENYQADISYRILLEEEPMPGDIISVTWKAKASIDIPALKMMPVDHSESVGWWKVMIDDESDDNVIVARDIKAGEVFEINKTFVVDTGAASTDCNLRVWYDYDGEGPGPCEIIAVRD